MKKTICRHSALFGFLAMVLGLAALHLPFGSSLLQLGLCRMLLGAACLALMAWLGGIAAVQPSRAGFGKTFRGSLWALLVAVALGLLVLAALLAAGNVQPGWPVRLLSGAYCFLMVGIFEEALFRGLLMQGFVNAYGQTRSGLLLSVTAAALIFGFGHVASTLMTTQLTGMALLSAALKTINTAQFGLLLSALYLKYRNFWALAVVHGINDFCISLGAEIGNETMANNYVAGSGLDANRTVIMYIVYIVLYMPLVIKALRILRTLPLPQKTIYGSDT